MAGVGSVVVAGAGPKLGLALAKRFAADGYRVLMLARRAQQIEALAASAGPQVSGRACDLTDAQAVDAAFAHAETELGPVACAVFNASVRRPGGILELSASDFEQGWRVGCLAGFHVGQAAARLMAPRGAGTILFTGATASLKGNAKSTAFAAQKFGLRAVAQSMARDLGPQGIHVAHIVIDGGIGNAGAATETQLDPIDIADVYAGLHAQPRSAWAQEIDVRPFGERF